MKITPAASHLLFGFRNADGSLLNYDDLCTIRKYGRDLARRRGCRSVGIPEIKMAKSFLENDRYYREAA